MTVKFINKRMDKREKGKDYGKGIAKATRWKR